jgi:hypothetical protein
MVLGLTESALCGQQHNRREYTNNHLFHIKSKSIWRPSAESHSFNIVNIERFPAPCRDALRRISGFAEVRNPRLFLPQPVQHHGFEKKSAKKKRHPVHHRVAFEKNETN